MSISDIVNVQITRETTPISRLGFGVLMILGSHKQFSDRIRFYSSASEILDDGFTTDSPEYIAANSAFSQSPRPPQIAIGRRSVDSVTIAVDEVDDSATYVVTINNVDFDYEAQTSDGDEEIAAGLVSAINAGVEPVTATDNEDGTFVIESDVVDQFYSIEVSDLLVIEPLEPSSNVVNDLQAVNTANDDWYALVLTSRDKAEVQDAAAWIEELVKIFGTASDDEDILDAGSTDDIAYLLQQENYDRTFVIYHDEAENVYPEAALFGKQLPTSPGSSTWANKTLSGINPVKLTTNERVNALSKNANTYERRASVNITREGKVASGEYIDIIRGIDWLEARMAERIYARLVSLPKIPFTDPGVSIIETEIRAQLDQAIEQGVIAADPEPEVTVPLVRDVPFTDRADRFLPDITFVATLQGAIHTIQVNGSVTV